MENNETQEVQEPQNPVEDTAEETKEEMSDRTKEQFDKLKESNQELKKERDQYKNVLDSLKPAEEVKPTEQEYQNLEQGQIDDVLKGMVTDDGYIDANKLADTLKQLDIAARDAKQRADRVAEHAERERIAREEQIKSETMRKVHEKYPQLDPENEQYSPEFFNLVRNEIIGQMMEGKEDVMGAAEKMSKFLERDSVTKEEKAKKEEVENQKAQINATRPRSTVLKGYYESEEEESLKRKVREGKKGAIAEMLRRRGQ